MKKILTVIGVTAIVFITLIQSCVKEEYEVTEIEWNPNIAVPLIHVNLTIADILEHVDSTSDIHDHLFQDGTGFLTLIYNSTLFSTTTRDLLDTFLILPTPFTILNITDTFSDFLPVDSLDLNLELFNKVSSGNFYFHDPKINIFVTNSIGVPLEIRFDTLIARSVINTPPDVPIEVDVDNDGFLEAAPNIIFTPGYPTVQGQSIVTTYSFDTSNSNIKDILAISPKYILFGVTADLNNPPTIPNFVTDTGKFSVGVEFILPLWGNATDFILSDTVEFELGFQTDTFQEVEYAEFKVNVENGLPVDVNIQLDFIDSMAPSVIIESLLSINTEVFLAATVVNSLVTQSTPNATTVFVDRLKLDKISTANKMIVKAKLATANVGTSSGPNSPLVKFYADYDLDIKLGVRVQLKTTF